MLAQRAGSALASSAGMAPATPARVLAAASPRRRRCPSRAALRAAPDGGAGNGGNGGAWTSSSSDARGSGVGASVLDPVWDVLNKSAARGGGGGGGPGPSARRARDPPDADANANPPPAPSPADRKTKIVCTIGPATCTRDAFFSLADQGMDVVRLNLSHGSHASHGAVIALAKEYNARFRAGKGGRAALGLLLDTRGPEVRSGDLHEPLALSAGDPLVFTSDPSANGRDGRVGVNYGDLAADVDPGDELLVDGGIMTFRVEGACAETGEVRCVTVDGGVLGSRRHLNVRGRSANLPALTERDMDDLKFGLEAGVDYFALSFVRGAQVLRDVKAWLARSGARGARVRVLAKIESADSVRRLEEILDAADGAMVARGDLGAECPVADVPVLQNEIIDGCRRRGKPVICATNMLESMIDERPVPTRAEVSDIAIAVREGADAVMLSGETAYGRHPLRAVATMSAVAAATERAMARYGGGGAARRFGTGEAAPIGGLAGGGGGGGGGGTEANLSELMAFHSVTIGDTAGFPLLVFSRTGAMPALLSHYRPRRPVFCFTDSADVQQRLSLYHGVVPLFMPGLAAVPLEEAIDGAMAELVSKGLLAAREHVAVVQSGRRPIWRAPSTHVIQLRRVERRHARAARALRAARQLEAGGGGAANLESGIFDADGGWGAAAGAAEAAAAVAVAAAVAAGARAPSFDDGGGALGSFGGGASCSMNDEDEDEDEEWNDD